MHRSDSEVAEEVAGVYLLNFFFCFGSKEKEKEKMLIKKKKMAVSGRQRKEGGKEQLPNSVTDDICSFFPLRRERSRVTSAKNVRRHSPLSIQVMMTN